MKKPKFLKKKPKDLKYYKREYIILQIELLAMFIVLLAVLYFNFNYLIFKTVMSFGYFDTNTLDEIYNEELHINADSDYYKTFDDVAISLFISRIQEKNNDQFTYLFLNGEFSQMTDTMEDEGSQTYIKAISPTTVYCKLTNFSKASQKVISNDIDKLIGYDYLILDLQDNPGGDLDVSYDIADLFLEEGVNIATIDTRASFFAKTYVSKRAPSLKYKHIYILQNDGTASAAEVLENALIENLDNTTTIGTQSYGKGIGQLEFKLTNNYGFKATVMRLFTPAGNSIHKVGIKPDISYTGDDILDFTLKLISGN